MEKGELVMTISENLDCSGLPELDYETCTYDEGFIASLLESFSGIAFSVPEKSFHRIILDKSLSTMNLKGLSHDPVDHLGGIEFGHGCLGRIFPPPGPSWNLRVTPIPPKPGSPASALYADMFQCLI